MHSRAWPLFVCRYLMAFQSWFLCFEAGSLYGTRLTAWYAKTPCRTSATLISSQGKFGVIINTITIVWIAFAIVLFTMPTAIPVTPITMSESRFTGTSYLADSAICRLRFRRFRRLHVDLCGMVRRLGQAALHGSEGQPCRHGSGNGLGRRSDQKVRRKAERGRVSWATMTLKPFLDIPIMHISFLPHL